MVIAGCKVAIQAKGDSTRKGNEFSAADDMQQVILGMESYRCSKAVVKTTGNFTYAALILA